MQQKKKNVVKRQNKNPSNVVNTRNGRFGVKIRFRGINIRIGSAYCTAEDASKVASVFWKSAQIDPHTGSICFTENFFGKKYEDIYVNRYLPYSSTKDNVQVVKFLELWLESWKEKCKKKAETGKVDEIANMLHTLDTKLGLFGLGKKEINAKPGSYRQKHSNLKTINKSSESILGKHRLNNNNNNNTAGREDSTTGGGGTNITTTTKSSKSRYLHMKQRYETDLYTKAGVEKAILINEFKKEREKILVLQKYARRYNAIVLLQKLKENFKLRNGKCIMIQTQYRMHIAYKKLLKRKEAKHLNDIKLEEERLQELARKEAEEKKKTTKYMQGLMSEQKRLLDELDSLKQKYTDMEAKYDTMRHQLSKSERSNAVMATILHQRSQSSGTDTMTDGTEENE